MNEGGFTFDGDTVATIFDSEIIYDVKHIERFDGDSSNIVSIHESKKLNKAAKFCGFDLAANETIPCIDGINLSIGAYTLHANEAKLNQNEINLCDDASNSNMNKNILSPKRTNSRNKSKSPKLNINEANKNNFHVTSLNLLGDNVEFDLTFATSNQAKFSSFVTKSDLNGTVSVILDVGEQKYGKEFDSHSKNRALNGLVSVILDSDSVNFYLGNFAVNPSNSEECFAAAFIDEMNFDCGKNATRFDQTLSKSTSENIVYQSEVMNNFDEINFDCNVRVSVDLVAKYSADDVIRGLATAVLLETQNNHEFNLQTCNLKDAILASLILVASYLGKTIISSKNYIKDNNNINFTNSSGSPYSVSKQTNLFNSAKIKTTKYNNTIEKFSYSKDLFNIQFIKKNLENIKLEKEFKIVSKPPKSTYFLFCHLFDFQENKMTNHPQYLNFKFAGNEDSVYFDGI